MKILIVTNSVSIGNLSGGVEVVSKLHLRALLKIGVSCDLLALDRDSYSDQLKPLNSFALPKARRILWSNRLGNFSINFIFTLWRNIKYYDVIHIHLCKDLVTTIALLICRIKQKPVVIQTHGMFLREDRKIDRLFNWLCKELSRYSSFHLILTESEDRWFLERNWQTYRIKIRNPVIAATDMNLAKRKVYDVCFLSRFHVRKRPLILIESIKILRDAGHSLKVRMAGSDEGEWNKCEDKIKEYSLEENFDLSSQVSSKNISKILNSSRIMVLPSFGEFVPMIVLESLSRGVPVICGRDCELAQELESNAICSLADEPNELAQAIFELLNNASLRNRIALKGAAWVGENCDPFKIARKLSEIYVNSVTYK